MERRAYITLTQVCEMRVERVMNSQFTLSARGWEPLAQWMIVGAHKC